MSQPQRAQIALSAGPKTSHVEVEVIGVGCIMVRPKDNVEGLTGAFVNISQESCFLRLPAAVPVSFHGHSGAVGEYEPSDVDGIGACVFAKPTVGTVVDIPAGVGPDMLNSGDRLVEVLFRSLLERVVTEYFPARDQRTERCEALAEAHACRRYPHNVYQRAFAAGLVFERAKLNIGSAQCLQAQRWIPFDAVDFEAGEQIGRGGEIERCPRIVLRGDVQKTAPKRAPGQTHEKQDHYNPAHFKTISAMMSGAEGGLANAHGARKCFCHQRLPPIHWSVS